MTFNAKITWIVSLFISAQTFAAIPSKTIDAEDVNPPVRVRLKGIQSSSIEIIGSKIKLGNRELTQNSVHISRSENAWVADLGSETYEFVGNSLPITGQSLFVEKVFVPPAITLTAQKINQKNSVDLIAILPLESYLEGVVAEEIPKSWPHEAQKAQAIAARTFTINKLKERRKNSFDVEATVMDQVFRYRKYESLSSSQKAVRETRGEYIGNSIGIIEPIFYHASCGGATDGADKVFSQPVSKAARSNTVKDSCSLNTKTTWQTEISKSELYAKLRSAVGLSKAGEILDIQPEARSLGGRALRLAVNTTDGKEVISGELLRSLIGYTRIKSTKFSIYREGDNFVFSGKGLGHGVGLCQWGSRDLALKGKSAREILQFYFPYLEVRTRAGLQANRRAI